MSKRTIWRTTRGQSGESAGPSTASTPVAIEPSTALQQDTHVEELGSEEKIVRQFYQPTSIAGEITTDLKFGEVTMYRYFVNDPGIDSWADGELSPYDFKNKRWGTKIAVKFYIVKDLNEEKAAKISQKVDALLSMQSYTNVFTPIFQVYNERVKSVILCYPHFDLHLEDWLVQPMQPNSQEDTLQSVGQNLLRPLWISFIRDTLSCIEPIDKMAVSKFGDLSSYVWKKQSKSIKIVLFPFENETIGLEKALVDFADLLDTRIRSHWHHPELQFELDIFIARLKDLPQTPEGIRYYWASLADNPLLQDYDGIASLIRMTWRPTEKLTPTQSSELNSTITQPDGHLSWKEVDINDPVMKLMRSKLAYSDEPAEFFRFIKNVAAHYPENYRNSKRDTKYQKHPVSVIKDTYHHVIGQIYMLSKKTEVVEVSKAMEAPAQG